MRDLQHQRWALVIETHRCIIKLSERKWPALFSARDASKSNRYYSQTTLAIKTGDCLILKCLREHHRWHTRGWRKLLPNSWISTSCKSIECAFQGAFAHIINLQLILHRRNIVCFASQWSTFHIVSRFSSLVVEMRNTPKMVETGISASMVAKANGNAVTQLERNFLKHLKKSKCAASGCSNFSIEMWVLSLTSILQFIKFVTIYYFSSFPNLDSKTY